MLRLILVQVLSKPRNHCSTLRHCLYAGSKQLPQIWTSASHPVPSNNPCISTSTLLGEIRILCGTPGRPTLMAVTSFRLQSQSRPLPRSPGYWFEAPLACISFVTVAAATVLTQRTPSLMLFHCAVFTLVLHYIGLATFNNCYLVTYIYRRAIAQCIRVAADIYFHRSNACPDAVQVKRGCQTRPFV